MSERKESGGGTEKGREEKWKKRSHGGRLRFTVQFLLLK